MYVLAERMYVQLRAFKPLVTWCLFTFLSLALVRPCFSHFRHLGIPPSVPSPSSLFSVPLLSLSCARLSLLAQHLEHVVRAGDAQVVVLLLHVDALDHAVLRQHAEALQALRPEELAAQARGVGEAVVLLLWKMV